MAMVFVGRDSVLKRQVAVKLLSPTLADDPVARKRFTREAESIAAVSHPNIVNVYHVGEIAGRAIPYFVMQFVDGPTLGMGALRGRMLTEIRVRRLMADVAAGLAAAHRRKVYHRDIKPNNIVLDGETGRALVLDFGISAAYSSRRQSLGHRLTDEGMYLGTPTYMSP
jgi:serine/threonine-protein kinase